MTDASTPAQAEPSGNVTQLLGRDRAIGIFCGLTVVALFSSFTLASRMGFSAALRPLDIAALRFGVAGVLLAPALWHFGWSGVRWREAGALAACGGLGFALLALLGFSLAPASHGGVLLHGTLVLTTFALGWVKWRTRITRRRAIGFLAILAGVVAMVWDSVSTSTRTQLLGDAALLMASVSWSAYGLLAARLGLRPAHSASIVAVLSMCCFFPPYLLLSDAGRSLLATDWHELVWQAMFQGVLIGTVSIFVYSRAVSALGAMGTALFTASVPCLTTIAAIVLFSEIPSFAAATGVVTVTAGMALAVGSSAVSSARAR